MNGIILSMLLSYNLMNPLVSAELAGGYHVGPFYGVVSVSTYMQELEFAWNYRPLSVLYDFRLGFKSKSFNVYLSRYCQHDIMDYDDMYSTNAGLRLVLRYSTW